MKLSVCYILKNEGATIYKSLDSVKTFVDEYVIGIDEGTTDNTRDEVKKFFDVNKEIKKEIYSYKWNDSFAEARNIGMDKATGTHILIMDGHEYIPEKWFNITENQEILVHKIMSQIKKRIEEDGAHEAFFYLYQQPFVGQIPNNYFLQPRIYLNDVGKDGKNMIRFGRAAHNVIRNTDPEKSIQMPQVMLIHDAPKENRTERAQQRAVMNIEQLKNDIKINKKDTRAFFYLGNTYMEISEHQKAIEAFKKYLKFQDKNTSEKYQVYFHMALEHRQLKQDKEALDCLHNAIRIQPKRRDAYLLAGDIYAEKEDHETALHFFNSALLLKPELSRMFSNGAAHTWMPYQRCAYSYAELGNKEKAASYLKRALRYVQCKDWSDLLDEWSGKKKNIYIIDKIGSFTKDFIKHLSKKYNVNMSKRYDRYLAEWADHIWQEWGDENLTQNILPEKTTVRIHGYEAYTNMHFLSKIEWEKFKNVVFVAEHIRDKFNQPSLNGQVKIIQNGIDIGKFYIKNKERPEKSIGYAGLMNTKKNPMRLAKIIKDNRNCKFHLRVTWQDPFLKEAFEYETKDCDNIIYHGYYEDLNDFWNQVKYVISTSDIESFSFNIGEAMAAGCHPLIYPWMGAAKIWPEDSFIKTTKLDLRIKRSMMEERRYIEANYPMRGSLLEMEKVLIGAEL